MRLCSNWTGVLVSPVELDYNVISIVLLVLAGLVGGFINTLAGGGSMLTLPALMMLGIPADIANATNRVGVFLQSATAVRGFKHYDKLDSAAILPMLVPTVVGALVGSLLASYLPVSFLKPTLLITMVLSSPMAWRRRRGLALLGYSRNLQALQPCLSRGFMADLFKRASVSFCWRPWREACDTTLSGLTR